MRHVAAHRLADDVAGRLGARDHDRIAQHVASCSACAARRDRLERARGAMSDIAAQSSPELGWDQIGVRLYWEASSARNRAMRREQRPWWRRRTAVAVAVPALLAAGFGLAVLVQPLLGGGAPAGRTLGARRLGAAPALHASTRSAPPAALTGVVTFASDAVTVGGEVLDRDALLARPLAAGEHISTGEGRLVVQFGPESGFALAPRSSLVLTRFDEDAIELEVDGGVEVEVARRRAGQRFDVVAGRHRVSVRGTGFRVEHRGGGLDVACAHGRVVVTDGVSEVALSAGERLSLLSEALLAHAARMKIDPAELAELDESIASPLLPAWTQPTALFETSSTLDVDATHGRAVRLDGLDVGDGDFAIRVMSGRHHLQVADVEGTWSEGDWIDAAPGGRRAARVSGGGATLLEGEPIGAHEAGSSRAARRVRAAQLSAALDGNTRARQCMEPLEKRDLVAGSFVVFDIGINPDGSQGHLNVADGNVPPEVEHCLRRLVDSLELPTGQAATLRYKLAF